MDAAMSESRRTERLARIDKRLAEGRSSLDALMNVVRSARTASPPATARCSREAAARRSPPTPPEPASSSDAAAAAVAPGSARSSSSSPPPQRSRSGVHLPSPPSPFKVPTGHAETAVEVEGLSISPIARALPSPAAPTLDLDAAASSPPFLPASSASASASASSTASSPSVSPPAAVAAAHPSSPHSHQRAKRVAAAGCGPQLVNVRAEYAAAAQRAEQQQRAVAAASPSPPPSAQPRLGRNPYVWQSGGGGAPWVSPPRWSAADWEFSPPPAGGARALLRAGVSNTAPAARGRHAAAGSGLPPPALDCVASRRARTPPARTPARRVEAAAAAAAAAPATAAAAGAAAGDVVEGPCRVLTQEGGTCSVPKGVWLSPRRSRSVDASVLRSGTPPFEAGSSVVRGPRAVAACLSPHKDSRPADTSPSPTRDDHTRLPLPRYSDTLCC